MRWVPTMHFRWSLHARSGNWPGPCGWVLQQLWRQLPDVALSASDALHMMADRKLIPENAVLVDEEWRDVPIVEPEKV